MKALQLMAEIKKLKKPVFTFNDLLKITNEKRDYLKVNLFRFKKKNLIYEVEKGKYVITLQHPFITASNLIFPSYISFLSAYSYYQITTQIPKKISVVVLRTKKKLEFENYQIDFIKFQPKRFFGYKKEKFMGGYVFIAEKEKAVIDSLYLPKYCPLDETFQVLEERLELDKLIEYALRMDSIVLIKRLGYLLELKGKDVYEKIKSKLNKRYDLLNPLRKKTGQKNKKWRLIINEVL